MSDQQHTLLRDYMARRLDRPERLEALMPLRQESCELLVACRPEAYSASEIARAVEDCDARLLSLAVTAMKDAEGRPIVALTVDVRSPESIVRSLARYGYEVIFTEGGVPDSQLTEARLRVQELLHILDI